MHTIGILATWFSHDLANVIDVLVHEDSQPLKTVQSLLSEEQLGCFGTESQADIHILEP